MVRENKGLTAKEELEMILGDEDDNSDLGFPVSSQDGNETRAFSIMMSSLTIIWILVLLFMV